MSAARAVWLAVLLAVVVSAVVSYAVTRASLSGGVSCTFTLQGQTMPCSDTAGAEVGR